MTAYLVQYGETYPSGWRPRRGKSMAEVAARFAARQGPGRHRVYVALPKPAHANGAPMVVHAFTLDVGQRKAATA